MMQYRTASPFRDAKGARASDAMRAGYARKRRTRISPVIPAQARIQRGRAGICKAEHVD